MKVFASIKWRLQLWYGLILVLVLVGFGATAYQLERNRQYSHIDQELHRRVGVLANALRRPPPQRGPNGNRQSLGGQPPRGQNFDNPPLDGPPPDQFPDDNPPGQRARRPAGFNLPQQDVHYFEAADPHGFYFNILI